MELVEQAQDKQEEQEKLYLHSQVIMETLDLILEEDLVEDTHHKVDHLTEVQAHQKEELVEEINLILMAKPTLVVLEWVEELVLLEEPQMMLEQVDLV